MAHDLMVEDGRVAMFCTGKREDAWHLLGQRCEQAATAEEAITLSGLDYPVEKRPLAVVGWEGQAKGKTFGINAWGTFRRTKTGGWKFLATVGAQYHVVQNRYAFDFVDILLNAINGAHYESAGALGNGERIWVLAAIPTMDFDIVGGGKDHHKTFLLFRTGHGKTGVLVKVVTVRVVCNNTLQAAERGAGAFVRLKHTKNVQKRLDEAKRLVSDVQVNVKMLEDKIRALSTRRMTRETSERFFDRLFPKREKDDGRAQAKADDRRASMIDEILRLYEANDGGAVPEVAGTAYNLLNAVTQWTDHNRQPRMSAVRAGMTVDHARALNAVDGGSARDKERALDILLEVTRDNPKHVIRTAGGSGSRRIAADSMGASTGSPLLDEIAGKGVRK